jgi:hypothetical protein
MPFTRSEKILIGNLDDALYEINKLLQDCDNRLTLDKLYIVKRYSEFGLCIEIHLRTVSAARQYNVFFKGLGIFHDNGSFALLGERNHGADFATPGESLSQHQQTNVRILISEGVQSP